MHKALVVPKVLGLCQPPFRFELYHYGPYAYSLDEQFLEMEALGQIQRLYPKPAYGPSYRLTTAGEYLLGQLSPEDRTAIRRVAEQFGDANSQHLELRATAIWVKEVEGLDEVEAIVARVSELKPRYEEARVREEVRRALKLAESLQQALSC